MVSIAANGRYGITPKIQVTLFGLYMTLGLALQQTTNEMYCNAKNR
ncbi:MAG TPA: hypothetical protein VI278_02990 [Nitrososphaeraceae archaeon]